MSVLQSFLNHTPFTDKFLALFGSAYAAIASFEKVNAIVTALVGLATLSLIIARSVIAWRQVRAGAKKDQGED